MKIAPLPRTGDAWRAVPRLDGGAHARARRFPPAKRRSLPWSRDGGRPSQKGPPLLSDAESSLEGRLIQVRGLPHYSLVNK